MRHAVCRHPRRLQSVALLALAAACSRGAKDGAPDGAGTLIDDRAIREDVAPAEVLRAFARSGRGAVQALGSECSRPAYLSLRRSLFASMNAWRRSLSSTAEVTFGPEVAFEESGGALGAMDRAMTTSDCKEVSRQAYQVEHALRVADMEFERRGIRPDALAQALSEASYELGEAILEATPYVPEGDDAALVDVLGLLDGLERGSRALHLELRDAFLPFQRLEHAAVLADVTDRAALVRATGVLGARLRAEALSHGMHAYPKFPVETPTDAVSALTLPRPAASQDVAAAALGEKLFFDTGLSRDRVRSCATCHDPARAYSDGLVAPVSLDPATPLLRNTPSLLYAPIEAVLTWDGRIRTADAQALSVIHTRAEMGVDEAGLARLVRSDAKYADDFRRTFGADAGAEDVGRALSAFEARTFVPDSSPLDRYGRGEEQALSPDERHGLDVFAGKGRCARCHVPPLFGGSRPPDFTAPVFSVLGVPKAPGAAVLDADPGREGVTHRDRDLGAFKVPTVRNVARTAPYFHNGRFETLEQVVEFYDLGGGRGLGIPVPEQDPEVRPLHLSPEDKRVLIAFMRVALEDTPERIVRRHQP